MLRYLRAGLLDNLLLLGTVLEGEQFDWRGVMWLIMTIVVWEIWLVGQTSKIRIHGRHTHEPNTRHRTRHGSESIIMWMKEDISMITTIKSNQQRTTTIKYQIHWKKERNTNKIIEKGSNKYLLNYTEKTRYKIPNKMLEIKSVIINHVEY